MREIIDNAGHKKYIAEDGREFYGRYNCAEHERQINGAESVKRAETLPNFAMTPPFTPDDEEWRWFYVTNQSDVHHIAAAFFNTDSAAHAFKPESFPCWIAAVFADRENGTGYIIERREYVDTTEGFKDRFDVEIARKMGKDILTYRDEFERFWSAYPRKSGKKAAFREYQSIRKEGRYSSDDLLNAARNYAKECRKNKTDKRLLRYASSFLGKMGAYADYLPGFYRDSVEKGDAE